MKKKIRLNKILELLKQKKLKKDLFINNITNLKDAKKGDLSLCINFKYIEELKKTKASACITSKKFLKYVPTNCIPLISKEPEIDYINVLQIFYKDFIFDNISIEVLKKNQIKKKFKNIFFGKNFICDKNTKIDKNCKIGHNVVINKNCSIGKDVIIGSNVILSNCIIESNVVIGDGSVIGKKGFGFKFLNGKLMRIPHIGKVVIKQNSEIGSLCKIDRGSLSDTVIGEYTFLDNQIQIAHNVKIGNYCMIAAQVGISGSSIIGDNVSIGGQSGISGHLKIGNNVKIGGKSGVVKNIEDNKTVMGYPAIDFREFIKKNLTK